MLEQIWSLNQVFGKINKMIIIKSFSVRRLRASWTSPQRRHVPRPFPFWKHYFVKFRPNLPSYRRGGRTDPSPWWRQTFFSINTGANGCIQGCLSVSLLETTSGCPSLRITAEICFLFKKNPLEEFQSEREGFSRFLFSAGRSGAALSMTQSKECCFHLEIQIISRPPPIGWRAGSPSPPLNRLIFRALLKCSFSSFSPLFVR